MFQFPHLFLNNKRINREQDNPLPVLPMCFCAKYMPFCPTHFPRHCHKELPCRSLDYFSTLTRKRKKSRGPSINYVTSLRRILNLSPLTLFEIQNSMDSPRNVTTFTLYFISSNIWSQKIHKYLRQWSLKFSQELLMKFLQDFLKEGTNFYKSLPGIILKDYSILFKEFIPTMQWETCRFFLKYFPVDSYCNYLKNSSNILLQVLKEKQSSLFYKFYRPVFPLEIKAVFMKIDHCSDFEQKKQVLKMSERC